jgi:hypothetical protein
MTDTPDALRELLATANLPWELKPPGQYSGQGCTYEVPQICMSDADYYNSAPDKDDAALIVAAVNALPGLLDTITTQAAQIAALEEEVRRKDDALQRARRQFLLYRESHLAKGTNDGAEKAATNHSFMLMCNAALTDPAT